jgi:hypothetical protein
MIQKLLTRSFTTASQNGLLEKGRTAVISFETGIVPGDTLSVLLALPYLPANVQQSARAYYNQNCCVPPYQYNYTGWRWSPANYLTVLRNWSDREPFHPKRLFITSMSEFCPALFHAMWKYAQARRSHL